MKDVKDILRHHLNAAWQRRQSYIQSNRIEAFRLISQEELEMPVAVDCYGESVECKAQSEKLGGRGRGGIFDSGAGVGVLQVYDEQVDRESVEALKDVLREDFGVEVFFEKRRYRVKDAPESGGDLREAPVEKIVSEYGHKFILNLNNYLDTGLFLDHRETRRRVEQMVRSLVAGVGGDGPGVQVLNLFAYTGSFSVYAAAGGAAMTHTVDLSKTYCDWARRNLELNGFAADRHWIYRMDALEYYRYAARKGLTFDLVIIDPPTFSRNKDSNFSVQRDHQQLIEGAASLLRPGGQIIFSNNCLDFQMSPNIERNFTVRNIQSETIPQDFWIDTVNNEYWGEQNQIHNCYLITI